VAEVNVMAEKKYEQQLAHIFLLLISIEGLVTLATIATNVVKLD